MITLEEAWFKWKSTPGASEWARWVYGKLNYDINTLLEDACDAGLATAPLDSACLWGRINNRKRFACHAWRGSTDDPALRSTYECRRKLADAAERKYRLAQSRCIKYIVEVA